MKKETLEEAAKEGYNNMPFGIGLIKRRSVFLLGAKWLAKRRYTYDELRQIAYTAYCKGQLDEPTEGKFNLWIQQFKKK